MRYPQHVNTAEFAAWHIPCFSNHNCPSRLSENDDTEGNGNNNVSNVTAITINLNSDSRQHSMAGSQLSDLMLNVAPQAADSDKSDALLIFAFLWMLIVLTGCGQMIISAGVCTKKSYRRPYNLFVFSILASDVVMAFVVMPIHALHISLDDGADMSPFVCLYWMYSHLVSVCVRSWTVPCVILLYHLHDGLVPPARLGLVLVWTWLGSGLLVLPAILSGESFIDRGRCSVRPDNTAMIFYVSVLVFFLPAGMLAPAYIRWSDLRSKFNLNEFVAAAGDMATRKPEEVEAELEEKETLASSSSIAHSSSSWSSSRCLTDKDFPSTLYTLAQSQLISWGPFFLLFTSMPFLVVAPPRALMLGVLWLGYAQTTVTPVLIWLLSERTARNVNRALQCHRRGVAANTFVNTFHTTPV